MATYYMHSNTENKYNVQSDVNCIDLSLFSSYGNSGETVTFVASISNVSIGNASMKATNIDALIPFADPLETNEWIIDQLCLNPALTIICLVFCSNGISKYQIICWKASRGTCLRRPLGTRRPPRCFEKLERYCIKMGP